MYARRAAEWHAANQLPLEAVHDLQDAGDDAATVRMMADLCPGAIWTWPQGSLPCGFAGQRNAVSSTPTRCSSFQAALVCSLHGEAGRAARFARGLYRMPEAPREPTPPGGPDARALQALIRGYSCERPAVTETVAEAQLAWRSIPNDDRWHRPAGLALGMAHMIDGHDEAAEAVLSEIATQGVIEGIAPNARATGLAFRARFRAEGWGPRPGAPVPLETASEIRRLGALEGQGPQALQDALLARIAIAEQRQDEGRGLLQRAQRLRSLLTWAMPSMAVITRLELAKAHLGMADAGPALAPSSSRCRTSCTSGRGWAGCGTRWRPFAASSAAPPGGTAGASTLTGAELRLVPMLATHLTFAETDQRLAVSDNTIKSQAMSVYRKLDATSRGEAVQHAVRVGLIDPAAVTAIVMASPPD